MHFFLFFINVSGYIVVQTCPAGWVLSPSSCYQLSQPTKSMTWSFSRLACQAIGKQLAGTLPTGAVVDLASVHSPKDHVILAQAMKANTPSTMNVSNYWIGLHDRTVENHFVWSDNTTVDYTAWSNGQPDNWRRKEDCGEIKPPYGYLFNDAGCDNQQPFICGFSRCKGRQSVCCFFVCWISKRCVCMSVCVCVCVRACVHACACVCVCVCVWFWCVGRLFYVQCSLTSI